MRNGSLPRTSSNASARLGAHHDQRGAAPDLKDGVVYFVVALTVDGSRGLETQYALIQLPQHLPRFVILPSAGMGITSRSSTTSFGMNSAACSACSDRWRWC